MNFLDVIGTLCYFPPELYWSGWYYADHATTWSLGVLLYFMICGELPFNFKIEIVQALVRIKAHVSAECWDLVGKLLEFSPDQRMPLYEITRHPWMMEVEEKPKSVPSDDDGLKFHSFTVHRRYYERFLTLIQAYRHRTRVLP